MKKLTNTKQRR